MAADQECCRRVAPAGNTGVRDVRALGVIMMELMQKYVKEDGAVGIENLDRWPSDSAAVGFLSATTSASSLQELLKVSREWSRSHHLTFTAPSTSV